MLMVRYRTVVSCVLGPVTASRSLRSDLQVNEFQLVSVWRHFLIGEVVFLVTVTTPPYVIVA